MTHRTAVSSLKKLLRFLKGLEAHKPETAVNIKHLADEAGKHRRRLKDAIRHLEREKKHDADDDHGGE